MGRSRGVRVAKQLGLRSEDLAQRPTGWTGVVHCLQICSSRGQSGGARAVSHDSRATWAARLFESIRTHAAAQDRDCRARPEAKHGLSIHLRSRRCDLGGVCDCKDTETGLKRISARALIAVRAPCRQQDGGMRCCAYSEHARGVDGRRTWCAASAPGDRERSVPPPDLTPRRVLPRRSVRRACR